jgi:hypothetical protein
MLGTGIFFVIVDWFQQLSPSPNQNGPKMSKFLSSFLVFLFSLKQLEALPSSDKVTRYLEVSWASCLVIPASLRGI